MSRKKLRLTLSYPKNGMEITLNVNCNFRKTIISQYACHKTGTYSFVFISLKDFYQCIDKAHEYV